MGARHYAYIGGGCLCLIFAATLALVTTAWNWNREVWHSGVTIINVVGLFLIWYGFRRGYYERMLAKAKKQIEDTGERDI